MTSWRVARSLNTLLAQINAVAPGRDKTSDGSIGDTAHAASKSEHNPDRYGIVRARDFTNDPARGFDSSEFADRLLKAQDPRLLYVISDARIGSGPRGRAPGVWRKYSGANPHRHHAHVSVVADGRADGDQNWAGVGAAQRAAAPPTIVAAHGPVTLPEMKQDRTQAGNDGWIQLVQKALGVEPDGIWGNVTDGAVRDQQARYGLDPDGWVGAWTWASFVADGGTLRQGVDEPVAVEVLQNYIGAAVDGDYGPGTEGHVRAVQAWAAIEVDGIVGPQFRSVLAAPPTAAASST